MSNFNFRPLFRTAVGFDQFENLLESVSYGDQPKNSYPPYNIETWKDDPKTYYRVTIAVPGLTSEELKIKINENTLAISGKKEKPDNDSNYLHRGRDSYDFSYQFSLADHIIVDDANLNNGILNIDLVREIPEDKKTRNFPINTKAPRNIRYKTKSFISEEKAA